jgi:hypothetical protein
VHSVVCGNYTFHVGDAIQFLTDGKKNLNFPDPHIIDNFDFTSDRSDVIINYSNKSYDNVSTIVEMLKFGEALLIPEAAFKAKEKKVSTKCECEKLKLRIATLQKKNDELTNALTLLAERAMNAAGWRMKLELKEK